MGLGAKSHHWTRTPGNLDICLPCGQYAHENPTIDCPAYRPDYDPEVLRKRITELEAALRVVDDDVRHHLRDSYAAPGTTIPASLIRPHAIKAVRDALKKS